MEEKVGELWHRFITGIADQRHLEAVVKLSDIKHRIAVFFRALGGDSGLQIEVVDATASNRRRSWLQHIAGTGQKVELAWRDHNALKLPAKIAWFEQQHLNRDLYYWLAAMAANQVKPSDPEQDNWVSCNQLTVLWTLKRYPGLLDRYAKLVKAHVLQRPNPETLSKAESRVENEIRQALVEPGSLRYLSKCKRDPFPVPLWLNPSISDESNHVSQATDEENNNGGYEQTRELEDMARRNAEYVNQPEEDRGLITVRMENIFTWGEFVNLDRGNEDEDDADQAEDVARDLDVLSVTRNRRSSAIRLKFDLDLPSASEDDEILDQGFLLPEWDWKKNRYIEDCCRIVEMLPREVKPAELPDHLKKISRRLRQQFQMLAPSRSWFKKQNDGQDIDLDAYLGYAADKSAGVSTAADGLFLDMKSGSRDLCCMLVADLSLSTDTWVNNHQRVIDMIRDSLFLFAESLQASGDDFSMVGFSSRKRDPIRIHLLKRFGEDYNATIRGRINDIKPGYYTRLGAAIRYATEQLKQRPGSRRLLLILSDGKPNDLDQYEGRFGIEDTRQAIIEAKKLGLQPFCVTIDEKANQYLPHLFGSNGYALIHNPLDMPKLLPRLYVQLTQ